MHEEDTDEPVSTNVRVGFGTFAFVVSAGLTAWHIVLLEFGFFDRYFFLTLCGICLALLITAAALLVAVDRIHARLLLVANSLLALFWVAGLASLRWAR